MHRDTLTQGYPKELEVLRTSGRLVDEWANVLDHCVTEARVAAVLAKRLGFGQQDTDDLVKAALLHDWNKRNEREAANREGFQAYNQHAVSGARALLGMGYSLRIVTLIEAVGHTALGWVRDSNDLVARVMHYIDTITFGETVVGVDERMTALEAAPRYRELNESGRAIYGGKTYFEVQREVGKEIERQIEARIGEPVIPMLCKELGMKTFRHFVCYPCAEPARGKACAIRWQSHGYEPLVMTYYEDWTKLFGDENKSGFNLMPKPRPFPGYYNVINSIASRAFRLGADLVTCIGDDMAPPLQGAQYHARLYFDRFPAGDGVMQCTGDRQGGMIDGKVPSERICGSPTFGKAWSARAFMGKGPFGNYGFKSYYADELLHDVAGKLGLLYMEPALRIDHEHWSFGRSKREWWHDEANKNWAHDQTVYLTAKANGFPEGGMLS